MLRPASFTHAAKSTAFPSRVIGTITRFVPKEQAGFIRVPGAQHDFRFHVKDLAADLPKPYDQLKVEFTPERPNALRPFARDVRIPAATASGDAGASDTARLDEYVAGTIALVKNSYGFIKHKDQRYHFKFQEAESLGPIENITVGKAVAFIPVQVRNNLSAVSVRDPAILKLKDEHLAASREMPVPGTLTLWKAPGGRIENGYGFIRADGESEDYHFDPADIVAPEGAAEAREAIVKGLEKGKRATFVKAFDAQGRGKAKQVRFFDTPAATNNKDESASSSSASGKKPDTEKKSSSEIEVGKVLHGYVHGVFSKQGYGFIATLDPNHPLFIFSLKALPRTLSAGPVRGRTVSFIAQLDQKGYRADRIREAKTPLEKRLVDERSAQLQKQNEERKKDREADAATTASAEKASAEKGSAAAVPTQNRQQSSGDDANVERKKSSSSGGGNDGNNSLLTRRHHGVVEAWSPKDNTGCITTDTATHMFKGGRASHEIAVGQNVTFRLKPKDEARGASGPLIAYDVAPVPAEEAIILAWQRAGDSGSGSGAAAYHGVAIPLSAFQPKHFDCFNVSRHMADLRYVHSTAFVHSNRREGVPEKVHPGTIVRLTPMPGASGRSTWAANVSVRRNHPQMRDVKTATSGLQSLWTITKQRFDLLGVHLDDSRRAIGESDMVASNAHNWAYVTQQLRAVVSDDSASGRVRRNNKKPSNDAKSNNGNDNNGDDNGNDNNGDDKKRSNDDDNKRQQQQGETKPKRNVKTRSDGSVKGFISYWSDAKGYGFLKVVGGERGEEYFFNKRSLHPEFLELGAPKAGVSVWFTPRDNGSGQRRARDVDRDI